MTLIENANVVLESGILPDGAILIEGDRIRRVCARAEIEPPAGAERINAQGLYVGPGLVDLHVHAAGETPLWQEPLKGAAEILRGGTTTLLVSPWYRQSAAEFAACFERVRRAQKSGGAGRCIAGVYAEGPYINPKYGASSDLSPWNGAIRAADYEPLVDAADDLVKIWVIAPEREGILPFVQYAKKKNPAVRFSVGHSEATPEQIRALKPYGLRQLTHCMNATGRVSAWEGTRGSGPDEACFLDPEMAAELISDSGAVHVNADLQRLILRIKGTEGVILVSDCSGPIGGAQRYDDLNINDRGQLSGSRLTMAAACRNIMKHTGCGITEAFLLAARNPARAIGAAREIGTVEEGKKANLIFTDGQFHVEKVMLEGSLL